MSVEDYLNALGMKQAEEKREPDKWSAVVPKPTSRAAPCLLITGDVGTGKSGLAYWLLERFSQEYGLLPVVVGFPRDRRELLPDNFVIASIQEVKDISDAVIFIDEADLQLPFTDSKFVPEVINFLNLPRHRQQILILAFHYPRLIRGTYLPSFSGFLLKRPPYLLQFEGKKDSRELTTMMERAEERFSELPEDDVVSYTYVVAPRLRWQGMLKNSLCSFWNEELSRAWSGAGSPAVSDQDYVELMMRSSRIETGTELECMVCHGKFSLLISGVCEACFRKWVLSTRKEPGKWK